MVSEGQAVEAAREFLLRTYGDGPPTIIVEPGRTVDYGVAWGIRFDSAERRDTGDATRAPIQRMVLVPKDGSPAHFPPTAVPTEEYLAKIRSRGEWPRTGPED